MRVFNVFDQRFRGFRVVEIGGVGVLVALALVVYLAKTNAGGERADIDKVQSEINSERDRVALLRAEVADLEQPERLESLSNKYLGLQPVAAGHEIDPTALADIAHAPAAQTAAPAPTADSKSANAVAKTAKAPPIDSAAPHDPALDDSAAKGLNGEPVQ